MSYRRRCGRGGQRYPGAELLWQPTLTVHDPNPPITLEHAAAAAADYYSPQTLTTLGVQ